MADPTVHTVVFLHSFPMDRAMWDAQRAAVESDGHRALALDLAGFGDAPLPPDAAPTIETYAAQVLSTLDAHGVARAVFVGLSLGGYVALCIASMAPARVAALVLADTRSAADDPPTRAGRIINLSLVRDRGVEALFDKMRPMLLAPDHDPAVATQLRAMALRQRPESVAFALVAMRDRPDRGAVLDAFAAPTLVLVGDRDVITPPAEMTAMAARMRDARVEVLEGAGHLSNLERPEGFNRALRAFLRGLPGA